MTDTARRCRTGGREGRLVARAASHVERQPFLTRKLAPFEVLGEEGRGIDLSENGQALDAIRQNGPGQHFLGSAHTLANFETAFYCSATADNNSFEQWTEESARETTQRASAVWKSMLASYEAPPIDPAVDEALLDYIARRRASFPDSDV